MALKNRNSPYRKTAMGLIKQTQRQFPKTLKGRDIHANKNALYQRRTIAREARMMRKAT